MGYFAGAIDSGYAFFRIASFPATWQHGKRKDIWQGPLKLIYRVRCKLTCSVMT